MRNPPENDNTRRVALTTAEIETLLKACTRYRASLPIYLQSTQTELEILEALIRKLS